MGLTFSETMAGTLTDSAGRTGAVRFDLHAEATDLAVLARTGETCVMGTVSAPPWVASALVHGTLGLHPLRSRTLDYDLRFRDEHDAPWRFAGRKHLSLRHPVRGMTTLPGSLLQDDEVVATGVLTFDLHGLVRFLASWHLRTTLTPMDPHRATQQGDRMGPALSLRQRRILAALAEATLVPGEVVPPGDAVTVAATIAFLGHLDAPTRHAYGALLDGLNAACRATTGRALASLPLARRRAWLDRAHTTRHSALPAQALGAAALPLRAAHFSRTDYLTAAGVPTQPAPAPEPPPRWMQGVVPIEDLAGDVTLEADVVVVGTGAGGAVVAAALAEHGLAVAVIEAGVYRTRPDFSGPALPRVQRLWTGRGLQTTVGTCTAMLPTGSLVGGTTAINSGTCLRPPEAVLAEWRAAGLPADLSTAGLSAYLDEVDRTLRVQPGTPAALGRIAHIVGTGADAMGLPHGALPRNAEGCDGQGTCILGCPTGAKRSTDVSWVPRALQAGASLFTGLRVRRVLMNGRRAVGVTARGTDAAGRGHTLQISARAVVISTGTLVTPLLLQDSGFTLPQLGRNLSIHPGLGLYARMATDGTPWRAIPQGYGVHGHGVEGVSLEGFYLPPALAGLALPTHGPDLTRWMDHPARIESFGFMVRDPNDGRVVRAPGGRVIVRKDMDRTTKDRLQRGAALVAELLLRGGATEVLSGIARTPAVHTPAQARALAHAAVRPGDFTVLGAHPLGTCRMGTSPQTACVDAEHRVFGTENLCVVDGSAVPSSLGVNPQITIMALALRAADALASRLSA